MRKRLAAQGVVKLLSGALTMGLLLFLPAGTLDYPGAWRLLCVFFIPAFVLGLVLLIAKPELLAKRLSTRETEPEQRRVLALSSLIFAVSFLLCALDFRFGWSAVPAWLSKIGCIVFLAAYMGFAELLRENEYLSRSVELQAGQKVVSTGMYGVVRHPMYAVIIWLFLSMPLILGSYIGLIPLAFIPYVLVKRLLNEEELLRAGLEGYDEYMKKVRYRLIPFVW